jgi:lambda family phage portal protein
MSTVRSVAGVVTERWDARVGRWVAEPQTSARIAAASPASVAAPSPAAASVLTRAPARVPRNTAVRAYAAARSSRFNVGLGAGGSTSADAELHMSLSRLRASARQLMRDAPYARRARTIIVNNVIGPGIGLQGQVQNNRGGEMNAKVNDDIEAAHTEWSKADQCHTGGRLHLADIERLALGQVFEGGELFVRQHYQRFGTSKIPLGLELIEPERVPYEMVPSITIASGLEFRMGAEVDRFQRVVAWWVRSRHPGDVRMPGVMVDQYERVPAADMFHLGIISRWPQTRCEPWMHTVIRKLDSMDQLSAAELQAAQADAAVHGTIETAIPGQDGRSLLANNESDGAGVGGSGLEAAADEEKPQFVIENGLVQDLAPGEKLSLHTPTRPNTALDPFMRLMLREVAAGIDVSYESLSRDYSQTTYSSGRLAMLDDRDMWRVLQQWWIRSFRAPLYERWLQMAVLAEAIPSISTTQFFLNLQKYRAVKWKPRGWSWVDPVKEVAAYKEADAAGYISAEDIIAQTANGQDIEDVVASIKRSRALYEAADIVRDTTPVAPAKKKPPPTEDPPPDDGEGDTTDTNDATTRPSRVVSLAR